MAKAKKHAPKAKSAAQRPVDGAAPGASAGPNAEKEAFVARQAAIERAASSKDASDPRYGVFDAVTVALRLVDQAEPYRAAFAKADALVPGTSEALDTLPRDARALRYIRTQLEQTQNLESTVKVPPETIERADLLRRRMTGVLEYNLGEQEAMAAILAYLRQGQGHLDRVADLRELAEQYEVNAHVLAKDVTKYDPKDARRALDTAAEIQTRIDKERELGSARWTHLQAGANTLVLAAYDRVRRTLIFLDEDGSLDKYPSLHTAIRSVAGRTAPKRAGADDAPVNGEPQPQAPNASHPA